MKCRVRSADANCARLAERTKRKLRWRGKVGATGLKKVAGPQERTGHRQGARRQARAEAPPKKHRDKPGSHNLVGGGGETAWGIPKVGCGKLISKESEGVSTRCRSELVDGRSPCICHCVKSWRKMSTQAMGVRALSSQPSCCSLLTSACTTRWTVEAL